MSEDYVWRWRATRWGPLAPWLQVRFGARCRKVTKALGSKPRPAVSHLWRRTATGWERRYAPGMNRSWLIEFEDGTRVVAPNQYAVRLATEADWERWADEYAMRPIVAGPAPTEGRGSIELPAVEWVR